jgi:hypothetical protein
VGSRSKQRVVRSAEMWEASCEQCAFKRRGRFEYVSQDANDHQREKQGHLVHVVSEWKPF